MHPIIVIDPLTSNAFSIGCQLGVSVKSLADLGLVEDPFTREKAHCQLLDKLFFVRTYVLSGVVDASQSSCVSAWFLDRNRV